MKNSTFLYLITLVVFCIIVLLLINSLSMFHGPTLEKFILPNDVRGMAIVHNRKEYTLNFAQQNAILGYLNSAMPPSVSTETNQSTLNLEKIIIYTFRPPNIEIIPIAYVQNELLFKTSEWNSGSPLLDPSRGQLKTIIPTTFDP